APDLLDSPPICDCAAANPPNPTTAATATVANNLFLIFCSPLFSRRKDEPRLFASRNTVTRLMPRASWGQRGWDFGVPESSSEIGVEFAEPLWNRRTSQRLQEWWSVAAIRRSQ